MKHLLKLKPLSFAFAFVFLPPKKELEDWSQAFALKDLAPTAVLKIPKPAQSKKLAATAVTKEAVSPFSYNGVDRVSFIQLGSKKADWELIIPSIDRYLIWKSASWTGVSLNARELHHFYTRNQRRGAEPRYRVYTLDKDWDTVDLFSCSPSELLLLQKSNKYLENNLHFRLSRVRVLNSQELKREPTWAFALPDGYDALSIAASDCQKPIIESWPDNFELQLASQN